MRQCRVERQYLLEMLLSAALTVGAVGLSAWLMQSMTPDDPMRLPAALLPVVPILLMAGAIVRVFLRSDEYRKRRMLEGLALGAAIASVGGLIYGLLESVGLPRLPMAWAWVVIGGTFGCYVYAIDRFTRCRTS